MVKSEGRAPCSLLDFAAGCMPKVFSQIGYGLATVPDFLSDVGWKRVDSASCSLLTHLQQVACQKSLSIKVRVRPESQLLALKCCVRDGMGGRSTLD